MKILVVNSGSSSLKFQLFDMNTMEPLAVGLIEQIGSSDAPVKLVFKEDDTEKTITTQQAVEHHQTAITLMLELLHDNNCLADVNELAGIGHRIVHGGEIFYQPTLIDDHVCDVISTLAPLAPLHNPANLTGVNVTRAKAPGVPQVAVFDTAFHQTIPAKNYIYGLPYALYEQNRVRRYGFHGTSYSHVTRKAARYLGKDLEATKIIALHLGNGTSAAAILGGKSIDTSMGMTPVEGLLMGTRCGDIDAGILFYLAREKRASMIERDPERTAQELDDLVNKESGLRGICGENDMRTIIDRVENNDKQAILALDIFCSRIKKYIGAYLAALNGADAIIFTGGIGENASMVRALSCQNMTNLGLEIDPEKNMRRLDSSGIQEIQTDASPIKILVIQTNEELEIATQTLERIQAQS